MERWLIEYKEKERGPWISTGCEAPDAPAAWKLWDMWRRVGFVEYEAVQVYRVSLVARLANQEGRSTDV